MSFKYEQRFSYWLAKRGFSFQRRQGIRESKSNKEKFETFYICREKKSRFVLTLFHGAGSSALYPQLPIIKSAILNGIDVVCFDIDGHGRNSTTVFEPQFLSSILDDLNVCVPEIKTYQEAFMFAHSMGGAILCLNLIRKIPANLKSISIWASPTKIKLDSDLFKSEMSILLDYKTISRAVIDYGLIDSLPSIGSFRRKQYPFRLPQLYAGFQYVDYVSSVVKEIDDLPENSMSIPCLFVYGENDRIADKSCMAKYVKVFQNSDSVVIPKATHASLPFKKTAIENMIDFFLKL